VKNIQKSITRDTRINHESMWSPNLVTGKITKNMRNEPNFNHRHTQGVYPPFVWRDIRDTRLFMQNKPNFKTSRIEYQESRFERRNYAKQTQFQTKRTRNKGDFVPKSCKKTKIYPQLLPTFPLIYPHKADFSLLLQTFYAKQTQFTFKNRVSRIVHREYAKRTQFHNKRRSEAQIRRRRTHSLIYSFTHSPKNAKRTQFHPSCTQKPNKSASATGRFHYAIRHTQYAIRKKYAKRTQFTFKNRVSRIEHREYAKQTQFARKRS
jgi:hypothetical protein